MDLSVLGIMGIARLIAGRKIAIHELVDACLAEIARQDRLNAFITVTADEARRRARELDALPATRRGPLHGIPYAAKDVIATRGIRTTNGSRVTADWVPDVDAASISRLHAAGAVLVGKLNLWEFAMSGPSLTGDVVNPWSADHSPGGSSSGSGAAVAAGLVPFALGTDTGGSIRIPAAWCGIAGLRPTYDRISRGGVTVNAWSVDTLGPLAARAADIARVFDVLADRPSARASRPVRGLRVGVPRGYFFDDVHGDVERAMSAALAQFERLGMKLVDVDIPHAPETSIVRTLHVAEAAQYHEQRLRERGELFGAGLRARLEEARAYPAVDYIKALRVRALLKREVAEVFERCDIFATPTDVNPPPALGPTSAKPTPRNRGNTYLASMTGIPALAIPSGFTIGDPALPISLMLHGRPYRESDLFVAARAYQNVTDWHLRRPPATLAR